MASDFSGRTFALIAKIDCRCREGALLNKPISPFMICRRTTEPSKTYLSNKNSPLRSVTVFMLAGSLFIMSPSTNRVVAPGYLFGPLSKSSLMNFLLSSVTTSKVVASIATFVGTPTSSIAKPGSGVITE